MKLTPLLFVVFAALSPFAKSATIDLKDDLLITPSSSLAYEYTTEAGIRFDVSGASLNQVFQAGLKPGKATDFAKATSVKFSFEFTQAQPSDFGDDTNSFGMGSLLGSPSFHTEGQYDFGHNGGQTPPKFGTSNTGNEGGSTDMKSYKNWIDVEYVILSDNSFMTNVYSGRKDTELSLVHSYKTTLDSPIGDLLLNLSFDIKAFKTDLADCEAILRGIEYTSSGSVPEPSTASLGLLALGFAICRRSSRK